MKPADESIIFGTLRSLPWDLLKGKHWEELQKEVFSLQPCLFNLVANLIIRKSAQLAKIEKPMIEWTLDDWLVVTKILSVGVQSFLQRKPTKKPKQDIPDKMPPVIRILPENESIGGMTLVIYKKLI